MTSDVIAEKESNKKKIDDFVKDTLLKDSNSILPKLCYMTPNKVVFVRKFVTI